MSYTSAAAPGSASSRTVCAPLEQCAILAQDVTGQRERSPLLQQLWFHISCLQQPLAANPVQCLGHFCTTFMQQPSAANPVALSVPLFWAVGRPERCNHGATSVQPTVQPTVQPGKNGTLAIFMRKAIYFIKLTTFLYFPAILQKYHFYQVAP